MLERMAHRGACGCEKNTGDGAGIMVALPHDFFKEVSFFATKRNRRKRNCSFRQLIQRFCFGVPAGRKGCWILGESSALETEQVIEQVFVTMSSRSEVEFEQQVIPYH